MGVTEHRWGDRRNFTFVRHTFLVVTVKRWLKSVYIYGSYRKIKTGVPLFLDHSVQYSTSRVELHFLVLVQTLNWLSHDISMLPLSLWYCCNVLSQSEMSPGFLDPEGGSQKATLVVLILVVVISSLTILMAFLIRSGTQRNFAYTFMLTLPTDLPSQIFHLFSS